MLRSLMSSAVGAAARKQTAGRGMMSFGLGFLATRLATKSVPGALLVGAGLLGKYLLDRKQAADPKVNTAKEAVAANPEIAAEIVRENPAAMTDDYDDADLVDEIEERKKNPADPNPVYAPHA